MVMDFEKLYVKNLCAKEKEPSALPSQIVMIMREPRTVTFFEISDWLVDLIDQCLY